jgi:DNA-binding HxlR family transcriptional regulator
MLTRALQSGGERPGQTRGAVRIPPHVEYSLTEKLQRLLPAWEIINDWGKEKMSSDVRDKKG